MRGKDTFYTNVMKIALPVTLQSLLQSSFSVADQVMIGQLGSSQIAAVGLGAKFASLYSVLLGAIAAAAGIMISQYIGQREEREVNRSFFANFILAVGLAGIFASICILFPKEIMGLYTKDETVKNLASAYLSIYALSCLPMAIQMIAAVLLRCLEAAVLPLYASIAAVVLNTGMNYLLIFGKAGMPELGVRGAAVATVISQMAACILTLVLFVYYNRKQNRKLIFIWRFDRERGRKYLAIILPIIMCEFLWSLGENVYTAIYGNMGTDACAAMTLTIPIQTLVIGALSGLAQAAGILIGKSLGSGDYDRAYKESGKLMRYGLGGSLILSLLLLITGMFYVQIYRVEPEVNMAARQILLAFAVIAPVKVQNMILGGGIIRSGGKTNFVMWIDLIGTWGFGVPLGLLAAFVWDMSIPWVYFMLSLEECVRLGISVIIFRKRSWMRMI